LDHAFRGVACDLDHAFFAVACDLDHVNHVYANEKIARAILFHQKSTPT
jgi:hypothetical protein